MQKSLSILVIHRKHVLVQISYYYNYITFEVHENMQTTTKQPTQLQLPNLPFHRQKGYFWTFL